MIAPDGACPRVEISCHIPRALLRYVSVHCAFHLKPRVRAAAAGAPTPKPPVVLKNRLEVAKRQAMTLCVARS